jgi:coenzyme F420-dependent glucose-6-phosphate dehydrogenase
MAGTAHDQHLSENPAPDGTGTAQPRVQVGYTLSSEEFGPPDLVRFAVRAEDAGFDFCAISDHFHPWVQAQGHSPFVWSVLGGVATATSRMRVGTGVTCPILRTHPAIIAHAAATTAQLFSGRFFLGVGTGENLNEHILGDRWPRPEVRLAMLEEAVGVIRSLWSGETIDHAGDFYEVENARLFDPPSEPIEMIVSAFGTMAAQLAARVGDGFWGHGSDAVTLSDYADAGGTGPRYAQLNVCYGTSVDECVRTVHEQWPNTAIPGQLSQDLPTWTHFEQATALVRPEDLTKKVLCGPDREAILEKVGEFAANGIDHIYLHQIGPDQDAFFSLWEDGFGDEMRRQSEGQLASLP